MLANDSVNGATITSFDSTTTGEGTVDLKADGSFTYTPALGFNGTDSFTYTLSNDEGESTATVTMTVTNFGRFVDNTAPDGGDGSEANPFDTLQEALDVAQPGDTIFVFRGDGSAVNTGDINLPEGVNLVGEGSGLVLAQTIVPEGDQPLIAGTVTLGGSNTVSGFLFDDPAQNDEYINGESVDDIAILDNTFEVRTRSAVDLNFIGGDLTISENEVTMRDDDDGFHIKRSQRSDHE